MRVLTAWREKVQVTNRNVLRKKGKYNFVVSGHPWNRFLLLWFLCCTHLNFNWKIYSTLFKLWNPLRLTGLVETVSMVIKFNWLEFTLSHDNWERWNSNSGRFLWVSLQEVYILSRDKICVEHESTFSCESKEIARTDSTVKYLRVGRDKYGLLSSVV